MAANIRIGAVGRPHRDLLIAMYNRFEPLGEAFGLPPRGEESRPEWIDAALSQKMNLAAFTPAGDVVGHCFLAADGADSAEMAIFVHQEFRRIGIGASLVRSMLVWGGAEGLKRVWTLTGSENVAALRLQERIGFQLTNSTPYGAELEIHLPVIQHLSEMPLTGCAA